MTSCIAVRRLGAMGNEAVPAAAMLIVVTEDGRLLLHLRDDRPEVVHPGCWAGFGGALEPGETPLEGVRREMLEETGIAVTDPVHLGDVRDLEGTGRLVALFYVVGGVDPAEVELTEGVEVRLFEPDEVPALKMTPFVQRSISSLLLPRLLAEGA